MDTEALDLFNQLLHRYPHAAAGVLQDLCGSLGSLAHDHPDGCQKMDEYIATIRECFRPMDAGYLPDCHAWDQATHEFSRWLNGPRAVLHEAVREMTGWSEEKLAKLKQVFPRNVRAAQTEYDRLLSKLEDGAPIEGRREREIYLRILSRGLLNIRGNRSNTKQLLAQVDHLHNLPKLLADFERVELRDFYWDVERHSYLAQCDPAHAGIFDDLWKELACQRPESKLR